MNGKKDAILLALAEAKQARSEQGYVRAAELAREAGELALLAHALRHVSELARERGGNEVALASGAEAVDLYRGLPDAAPLDLANALRVTALALHGLARPADAMPLWREARGLYASVAVSAGVEECETRLSAGDLSGA